MGEKLRLLLTLEPGKIVRTCAEVVRIQYPRWGQVGGVGIAFSEFEGNSQDILMEYVNARVGLNKVFA